MFNTDKPIERSEDDLLNRATFSQELADAILAYTDTDNFTISLCGEWGCGKTSIIHMIIQEIREKSQYMQDEEKPIVIMFNPWNYSDKNQLISQFFKEVSLAIKKQSKSDNLKRVGSAIDKYSSAIDYSKYIPVVGQYIAMIEPIVKGVGQALTQKADEIESIESQKDIVVNELKDLKQKLIVVIDDIDRLNNDQIRLIFQLVNSVAGFPNMIYLLSFDKNVVVRALSEEQKCNGEEYLEKIIQVPFNVPEAKPELVHNVLFNELNKIVSDVPEDRFDEEHWHNVFRNCISLFANSIRDVNRIINAYRLKYSLMHKETNWVDLLCITTLQICAPEIYSWINNNISSLAINSKTPLSAVEQNKIKNDYMNQFKDVYAKSPETMLKIVQTLFPYFSWRTGGYGYSKKDEKELRYLQRISSPTHSKLYFHLSLEDVKISREDVLNSIELEQTELHFFLEKMREADRLQAYMQELNCCIDRISDNKYEMLFNEFIKLQSRPMTKKKQGLFEPSVEYDCRQFIWSLLKKAGEENSGKILIKTINSSPKDEFLVVLGYVFYIEEAYGRIGNDIDYIYRVVSEEVLSEIEKVCKKRLYQFKEDSTLLSNNNFYYVRMMWIHLDKKTFDDYMLYCLNVAQNIPRYLCFVAGTWSGGGEIGWSFDEKTFGEYLSVKEIYEKVQGLKSTVIFNELTTEEKQIAVAFSVWYESPDKSNYRKISEKTVNDLLSLWEKK